MRLRKGGRPTGLSLGYAASAGVPQGLRSHPSNLIRFAPAKGGTRIIRHALRSAAAGGLCPPKARRRLARHRQEGGGTRGNHGFPRVEQAPAWGITPVPERLRVL